MKKFVPNCVDFFVVLLTILFIALKLLNFIAWSWWWVLSPLWISFIIFCIVLIFSLLFALIFPD